MTAHRILSELPRNQDAGPIGGDKPKWKDAPEWATCLMCDPLKYFWSDSHHFIQYFVELRPAQDQK